MAKEQSNTFPPASTEPLSPLTADGNKPLPLKYDNVVPLTPGQNGQVFRAVDRLMGRNVFVKRYEIVDGQLAVALQEPQAAKEFEHPCLARVYTAQTQDDNQLILEMELLNDGSVQNLIDRSIDTGRWKALHRTIDLLLDAARGLAHLHARGYVHRDIKPANLLLGRRDAKFRCVVTNYGLAARLESSGRVHATKHARLYRPPEAFEGAGYSVASDVYQLGMVAGQLFGCPINYSLGSLGDSELLVAVKNGQVLDLDAMHPSVCKQLRDVVSGCLTQEMSRIPTTGAFISALEAAKRLQRDWSYQTTADGFRLVVLAGKVREEISVVTKNSKHVVTRKRGRLVSPLRRVGPDVTIAHNLLSRCRAFRNIID